MGIKDLTHFCANMLLIGIIKGNLSHFNHSFKKRRLRAVIDNEFILCTNTNTKVETILL